MNKDVIYIEPEDDITDILAKIKNAKTNIVALVPPKQASVLRSVVNFKLLAKVAQEAGKSLVLVSADSSLIKLAAFVRLPVARNLQSKPEIPSAADLEDESASYDDVIDDVEADAIADAEEEALALEQDAIETNAVESAAATLTDDTDKAQKDDNASAKKSKVPDFKKYRKFIIMGALALVAIVGFLIWALVIAPSAKIAVSVRAKAQSFSENIEFTKDSNLANSENGVFLLEAEKLTKTTSVEFEATGEVDKGEKASGKLTISRSGVAATDVTALVIAKGTKFTTGGLVFVTTAELTLAKPANGDTVLCNVTQACFVEGRIKGEVPVVAENAGEKYNIASGVTWTSSVSGVKVSGGAMSGGTTKIVKIVSEDDIKTAKTKLESIGESEGKSELFADLPDSQIIINSSFAFESKDPVSSPALGEELPSGKTATLSSEATFIVYGVDRVAVSEYIEAKVSESIKNQENQKVYSTGVGEGPDDSKAFFESFREADGKFKGKLKSTAQVGPEVTDQMVIEKSLGRKVGEVQSLLKSINGVNSVSIDTPFFWVTSIPNDINKVSVEITIEE